jgi:hypothetical protein
LSLPAVFEEERKRERERKEGKGELEWKIVRLDSIGTNIKLEVKGFKQVDRIYAKHNFC